MLFHSVYFWLKPGISAAEEEEFLRGVHSLTKIQSVRQCWFGKPASTDRPAIDRSYSYGLIIIFEDLDGHADYQSDSIHNAFRGLHQLWTKVVIYDFES
jgi:hypothetical protein